MDVSVWFDGLVAEPLLESFWEVTYKEKWSFSILYSNELMVVCNVLGIMTNACFLIRYHAPIEEGWESVRAFCSMA